MKPNAWSVIAVALLVLVVAWQGHYAAQLGVLGLTLGIFFGTLSLRRPSGDATSTGHG
ncbi:MAG TPA: hypothetical protein VH142_05055 [Polyangiaceae bacterium]|jgi:hypothetical protein|nr:hypothetical protein [Polyangiaceae bacterium]